MNERDREIQTEHRSLPCRLHRSTGQQDGRHQLGDHLRAQSLAHPARGRGREGGGGRGRHLAYVALRRLERRRRRRRRRRRCISLLDHEQFLGDGDRLAGEDGVCGRRQVRHQSTK